MTSMCLGVGSTRLLWSIVVSITIVASVGAPRTALADDGNWGPSVPGEFVVELTPDADPAAVNRAVGGVAAPERLSATTTIYRFRLPAGTDPVGGTDRIKNTNGVNDVHPNVLADLPEFFGGRRTFWTDWEPPDTTATAAEATLGQPGVGSAGLPVDGATGAGVVVAVLDTGLDAGHPTFSGRLAPGGYDYVGRDANPSEAANGRDDNRNGLVDEAFGHGTYVAGLVTLVAPSARILPIRVLDTDGVTSSWRILQGLDRAGTRRADIINLSLGGEFLGAIVERSIKAHADRGTIVVAAAGNEATSDLRYPAAFDGVVGVTSIDGRTGFVADFGNRASWIDVAAPGVRIVSAFPGARYATWGGTSASAPITAGALALVRAEMPTADGDDVIDRLTATAVPDGLSNVSAYGRIDVTAAVERAQSS